jgi:protein involved in polysaccharide export with SLBB domain
MQIKQKSTIRHGVPRLMRWSVIGLLSAVLAEITGGVKTMAQPPSDSIGDHNGATNIETHHERGYILYDKHLLEPGDQISFKITEDRKPSTNLVVSDSSELSVPYVGSVSVAGKTCPQLAGELKTLLEKEYYYRATVVIALEAVNKITGRVLVWGEVRNQGPIDIPFGRSLTVGEAILRAGGLTDSGDKKKVKIIRHDGNGSTRVIEVNVAEVVENGKTEKDVVVEPNDYIVVPTRSIRF